MWKIGLGLTVGFFIARYLYLNDLIDPKVEAAIKNREQIIQEKLGNILREYQLPDEEVDQTVKEVLEK